MLLICIIGLVLFFPSTVRAPEALGMRRQHFVAVDGKPSNSGSRDSPWDFRTALAQPAGLGPGDTIWLRGGVYHGSFKSRLVGAPNAPIIVRQFPGERATIDANGGGDYALTVRGQWTWYWGFEITCSNPNRTSPSAGSNPSDFTRPSGVSVLGSNTRFINMVVHDTSQAFGFWTPAEQSELYGNIIYFNGWEAADRGHGHGIYAQNKTGAKRIADNIIFDQFSHGIHVYTEGAYINGIELSGNIVFNNGVLSKRSGLARNILIGGGRMADKPTVSYNSTYNPFDGPGDNTIGYGAGCENLTLFDNYFAGGIPLIMNNCSTTAVVGNSFYGHTSGFDPADFPENTYRAERPTGMHVVVRPNQYDPAITYLAIYNWDLADRAYINASDLHLARGDRFEIRNVQDAFGEAVVRTYQGGGKVEIPLVNWSVAQPVGVEKPHSTLPEFGAFVVTVRRPGSELHIDEFPAENSDVKCDRARLRLRSPADPPLSE